MSQLSDNSTIWRFLSLDKFLDMLRTKTLFFANPIIFEDPYELTLPDYRKNKRYKSKVDEVLENEIGKKRYKKFKDQNWLVDIVCSCTFAYYTYVNCWHISEIESAAMWKLYSGPSYGIAIKTTYGKLKRIKQLQSANISIREVQYLDFDKHWEGDVKQDVCLAIKRQSFQHEKELRLIKTIPERSFTKALNYPSEELDGLIRAVIESKNPREWKSIFRARCAPNRLKGKSIPVNLNQLIDEVVVSPFASKHSYDIIKFITKRVNLRKNVIQSSLFSLK
jgi:hypothetical protein